MLSLFKKLGLLAFLLALVAALSLPAAAVEAKNGNSNNNRGEKNFRESVGKFFNWNRSDDDDEDEIEIEDEDSDEDSDDDDDYNYQDDDRLPRGLRHAPGIEKRVESGKGLPFGWWFKLFGGGFGTTTNGTTTTATTTLLISNLNVSVGTSTATVSWQTNKPADSRVYYSTTSPATTGSNVQSNASLTYNHSLTLSNLAPNTTYYYFVGSANAMKSATSSNASFTTNALPAPDTEAPEIIFNTIINVTASSARFIWVTDEAGNSKVWLSTSTPVSTADAPAVQSGSYAFYHDLSANSLAASTTYHYILGSADSAGNLATTTAGTFTTN